MGLSSSSDGSTRGTYHRGRERAAAVVVAAGLAAGIGLLARRRRPFRVEIRGQSMAPLLSTGDLALAVAIDAPAVGDVVVLEHPTRPGLELVKRVTAGPGELSGDASVLRAGEYWVEGDDPLRSTDSRHFGPVRLEQVRARVVAVLWPPPRWRVVRRAVVRG